MLVDATESASVDMVLTQISRNISASPLDGLVYEATIQLMNVHWRIKTKHSFKRLF